MTNNTLRSIGIASLVFASVATTGITCNSQRYFSNAWKQKGNIVKIEKNLNEAQRKIEQQKGTCNQIEELKKKIPPDMLWSKRVFILDSKNTDMCGFFYPKGQGYSVINPKCDGAIFHVDAHMLYHKIMRYTNQNSDARASFDKLLFALIYRNPATTGAVYFRYFSRDGRVPNVGPNWGSWLQERGNESQRIYKELEYLLEKKPDESKSNPRVNDSIEDKEPRDRAFGNAVHIISGRGFIGTGTGVEITEISRDYFGRFVEALDSASQGIDNQKLYKELSKQVTELYMIHKWVNSQSIDYFTNISMKKRRTVIEKQFIDMRNKVHTALELLRKGSPKAAEYLEDWLSYQVMPRLMEEMFARLNESLIMRHKGPPAMDRFNVNSETISALLQVANLIDKSANDGVYADKENALVVVRHIRKLVSHYIIGGVQDDSKADWESILKDTKCFDNAENAIIAAEIEEIKRSLQKSLNIIEQLPPKEKFYTVYAVAILMLAVAGYLTYSGLRKDD